MDVLYQKGPAGEQERRRLRVDDLMRIEAMSGGPSTIRDLYDRWKSRARLHAAETMWIDVTPDNPFDYGMRNHANLLFDGLPEFRVSDYPISDHATCCALEYYDCKTGEVPVAHYIRQCLAGIDREYVRLLIPVADDDFRITRIVYAYRHLRFPQNALGFPREPGPAVRSG